MLVTPSFDMDNFACATSSSAVCDVDIIVGICSADILIGFKEENVVYIGDHSIMSYWVVLKCSRRVSKVTCSTVHCDISVC
jgi:hypothetical protein